MKKPDKKKSISSTMAAKLGRLGGLACAKKKGKAYMRALGKKGGLARALQLSKTNHGSDK